jgi:hypothetical protein
MPVIDYIAIRGLKTSGTEVFRGIGGSSGSSSPGGDTIGLEWGEMPDEAISLMSQYTDDINTWLTTIQNYDPSSRDLPAVVPAIPALLTALATGGASLPAIATVMVTQAIVSSVGTALQNLASRFDANSLEYIMRTAMLYTDTNGDEQSVLNDRLSDLAYVDQVIDFGPFRVHIKGKMIEY